MNPFRFAIGVMGFSLIATCVLQAQATRTWVSGVGDDANPCSRTAPCKTFAGAISKTAAGGEIDALDPGGFGAVTITKSITIDGGGGVVASALVSGTNGITISAATSDLVTLRNLSIQGLKGSGLNGVQLNTAGVLHIEHCWIMGFSQNGIAIAPSSQPTAGTMVVIDDTVSQDNGQNGLSVVGPAANVHVTVANSRFSGNTNGVLAADYSRVAIWHSDASGNTSTGFLAEATSGTTTLNIADSNASNNSVAGVQAGGATGNSVIRLSSVSLLTNGTGLSIQSNGAIYSYGNNTNANGGTPTSTLALQ